MTPTIGGRLQTRVFLIAVIGSLWTLAIGPFLPPYTVELGDVYRGTFSTLAVVLVLGLLWELLYHGLQQFRWEKDWPTLFGLLTGINEGLLAWLVVVGLGFVQPDVPTLTFLIHFTTTWLVTFLFVNGPMRVFFLRHRFIGGRLL